MVFTYHNLIVPRYLLFTDTTN